MKKLHYINIKFVTAILILNSLFVIGQPYFKLYDFNGINGGWPQSALITDNTFMYGMTQIGGNYNNGIIFKIKPDGTSFTKLFDFDGVNGANPIGSLIYDGTYLYGMTAAGGTYSSSSTPGGCGVIFKMKPDGTGFTKLFDFGANANGFLPLGSLFNDGVYLYGVTASGGANGNGVVFKIMLNGTGYSEIFSFNGTNGSIPVGTFISDGTYFYGMTTQGSINDEGTIYKIKPDGTGFTSLFDFGSSNGIYPQNSLISDGTYLYGTTYDGGANNDGVIFKIKLDGTNYTKLLDFNNMNGKEPTCSLIIDNIYLYGLTSSGGADDSGVLFKIKSDGTSYSKLMDFSDSKGKFPIASLLSDGSFLYGTASEGGIYDGGVIFKYKICFLSQVYNNPQSICEGQNYTIGNNIYSNAGTYVDTLHTSLGCDSIISTQLSVSACTNIQELSATNTHIKIYPNPASQLLNVEFLVFNKEEEIKIMDLLGNTIKNSNTKTRQAQIDISDLSSGIYFIKIGNQIQKFVKE